MCEFIETGINGRVLEVRINRPETKNALTQAMYQGLSDALDQAVGNEKVRVILLLGIPGSFSSGNDLNDFINLKEVNSQENPILVFMHKLAACPKIVVAGVDGVAVGIGSTLLMHCDFVYASEQAMFSMPFVELGLCPEYAASLLLPKIVGWRRAHEYLMLAERVSAHQAQLDQFIHRVVDEVESYSRNQSERLAASAPEALRQTKALMRASLQADVEQTIQAEVDVFAALLTSAEFAEAAAAFFEKRAPVFK